MAGWIRGWSEKASVFETDASFQKTDRSHLQFGSIQIRVKAKRTKEGGGG